VKVNDDEKAWKEKGNTTPPIGNDKVIVASKGVISDQDVKIIDDFFSSMWQFDKVIWL
jgi:hypothetical protein